MHRARPQSARPARRVGNDDNDETRGEGAAVMPTRDIRLNMQDNMSFYKSPVRSRRESSARPTSAPPARAFIPGLLLPTADPASAQSLDRRPAGEQTSEARLPVQTRLCGLLERQMTESRIHRFRKRGLVALAQARGPHGDWSDSTSEQLQGLAKMLAHGECTAELTQMVSDPFFLQRRLALSSHSHLLADIDVCQDALTVLIQRERFERRYPLVFSPYPIARAIHSDYDGGGMGGRKCGCMHAFALWCHDAYSVSDAYFTHGCAHKAKAMPCPCIEACFACRRKTFEYRKGKGRRGGSWRRERESWRLSV